MTKLLERLNPGWSELRGATNHYVYDKCLVLYPWTCILSEERYEYWRSMVSVFGVWTQCLEMINSLLVSVFYYQYAYTTCYSGIVFRFNPQHTDVDYSRHSVFLVAPASPVVESKLCFQSWNTDICWDINFTNHTNFYALEVVDRGSETQL